MSSYTASHYLQIGQAEFDLAIAFRFDKGEPYPSFGQLAEPPTVSIISTFATAPNSATQKVSLTAKQEMELETWLLEHPERWE